MQESEAKAYFLRDMRQAREQVDKFYKLPHEFHSKKYVQTFLQAFRDTHQTITLFEYRKPSRHAWHYHHTFFYLEPTAFEEEGIGQLVMVQKSTLDSKKLIKNDLNELLKVDIATHTMFHRHFFVRLIQRAGLLGLKAALDIVAHSVGVLLLFNQHQHTELDLGQTLYVVFADKVFVVAIETEQRVMVFKTVLLAEFMTEKQQQFYANAVQQAKLSKNGFLNFVEKDQTLIRL